MTVMSHDDREGRIEIERFPILEDKNMNLQRMHRRHTSSEGMEEEEEERETVIITTRISEYDGDGDGDHDSGISCEDHLLTEQGGVEGQHAPKKERLRDVCIQVFIPFMIAGFGMMTAGLLLDTVQHWDVYLTINEIFILVPALLGLKGNLEMTLASRLSTAANVGHLDTWSACWSSTWGNLSLIQGQALIVAGLATLISISVGGDLATSHMLILAASAMGSAAIASLVLASVMIIVILVSHRVKINPDNVATPIAASLGDLVTLGLLSIIAKGLYDISEPQTITTSSTVHVYNSTSNSTDADNILDSVNTTIITQSATMAVSSLTVVILVLLIPVWLFLSYRNPNTRNVLCYGWLPVVCAMCISSGGGWVLSKSVSAWEGIAIYSPIINGVGGNLVAVQASRISTSLHSVATPGRYPSNKADKYRYMGPIQTFCSGSQHSKTATILVCMVIPGSAVFLSLIHVLQAGHTTLSPMFFIGYIICAVLQVSTLLIIADWMVHTIWNWGFDPDNIAIPFLTAMGDLLGTGLLSLGFWVMWQMGDHDTDVGD